MIKKMMLLLVAGIGLIGFASLKVDGAEIVVKSTPLGSIISIGDLSVDILLTNIGKISYKGEKLIDKISFIIYDSKYKTIADQTNPFSFEKPKIKETKDGAEVIFKSVIGSEENGEWEVQQTVLFSKDGRMSVNYKLENILDKGLHKFPQLHTNLDPKDYKSSKITVYAESYGRAGVYSPLEDGIYKGEIKAGGWNNCTKMEFEVGNKKWQVVIENGIRSTHLHLWGYLTSFQMSTSWDEFSLTYDFSSLIK